MLINVDKCTKLQFIKALTAKCSDWHIENSKNLKRRLCVECWQTRLTKLLAVKKDVVQEVKAMNTEAERMVTDMMNIFILQSCINKACTSLNYSPSACRSLFVKFLRATALLVARICYGNSVRPSVRLSVCLSVCLSVTRVDQSKTVEVTIMQFSPHSSPIPLVFVR